MLRVLSCVEVPVCARALCSILQRHPPADPTAQSYRVGAGAQAAQAGDALQSVLQRAQYSDQGKLSVCIENTKYNLHACLASAKTPKLFFVMLIFCYDILIKMKVIMFSILPTSLRD